ncbi:ribonuclease H-like domain-containing protein [Tanacetum coccineum]|uniref:Ribonuclease H-like domain-containing protein n=1 Tax=Tanacetum coccineum TaxID=301880 RepID=A0ABQ5FVU3_9ASTR
MGRFGIAKVAMASSGVGVRVTVLAGVNSKRDHNLWDIIVNGDLEDEATPSGEQSSPPIPKTAKQLAARRNQERIKSILLLAIQISLPPSWSQISLIMRNNPDIDEIDIDNLYNNLRVYKDERKKSSTSSSNTQNLAFLSFENTNSTHEVSTASGDFKIDGDDLEELDLRWQVAMLTVRVNKFIQRIGRNMDFKEKRPVSLDKSKIECYNCHRKGHFARECRSRRSQRRRPYGDNSRSNVQTTESSSQALVAQDGLGGYDWSNDFEVEPVNYALMAISSSNSSSSSDSEVQKYSKQCLKSFKCLQKNYDTEREKHNKAKPEIKGYEIALESLESRILGHEKNELAWGEKYEFQNYDLKCREIKINNLNLELEKMSTHDKNGLGFGTQMDDLSNKSKTDSENNLTVFEVRSSDEESTLANNRFTKANEYHAVPPPITGNPLTLRADISFAGLDEDEVIIEDWTSDDEDDVCVVKTVSSVKPNVTQAVRSQADKSGQTSQKQGIGFKKVHKIKACFVCKSTGHLIKDCDFYKSPEPRVKNVVNTGERVVKPV